MDATILVLVLVIAALALCVLGYRSVSSAISPQAARGVVLLALAALAAALAGLVALTEL